MNVGKQIKVVNKYYLLLKSVSIDEFQEIWLAKEEESGNKFIIKKINESYLSNGFVMDEIIHELNMLSQLNHSNIASIHDYEKNGFYIVTDYILGYDLFTIIKKEKKLPLNYAIKIILQIANALYYANNLRDINNNWLGIVHREINPQNILISNDGIPKIINFERKVGTHKKEYCFSYFSPEQVLGKALDGRSAIFSLATILYEIMVGRALFHTSGAIKTFKKIIKQETISLKQRYPEFHKQLNDIMVRALAKDKENRYDNAKEFSKDLEKYLIESQNDISNEDIAVYLKKLFEEEN